MPIPIPIPIPNPNPSPSPHLHDNHLRRRSSRRHAEGQDNQQPPQSPPDRSYRKYESVSESSARKLLCLFLKCIIMTFILSLFLVFIGFAALVLFYFLLFTATTSSGHGRRLRRQRQTNYHHSSVEQAILYSLQDIENLLPKISYIALKEQVNVCAICLENFEEEEICRKLPGCNHLFHVKCVDNWLVKVPNCPVCRNPVRFYSGRVGPINSEHDWRVWWPVDR